jgi:hypothetical protein
VNGQWLEVHLKEDRMRVLALAAVVFFGLLQAPQVFANWSLGSNLGLTYLILEDGVHVTTVGVPSGAGLSALVQPGLRIGFKGEESALEGYLDMGFALVHNNTGGETEHAVEATANFQDSFRPENDTSPYLTAGAGVANADNGFFSASSFVYGGGLGLWHKVANDHGRIRGEVRYDRVAKGDDNGVVVIDKADTISLKLGFDLWMK